MTSLLCMSVLLFGQPTEPVLRFRATPAKHYEVVAKLTGDAAKLPIGLLKQEQGETWLKVTVVLEDGKLAPPTMLGSYYREGNELIFRPRLPFAHGGTYRATLEDGKRVTTDFRIPDPPAKTPPKIVKIYPTANVLPANHLKFYIYFDRPMRGGKELFKQIVLVDDKGKEIDDSWLIDEIWDEENNCLIIYIHPGRIKWGVELRELLGPVLYEKREYSLVIRGTLTDIAGTKIGADVVKKFRTTPEDRVRIDLSKWKLEPALAGTSERLIVTMPKSIDHRSLQRFLTVTDDKGKRVEGEIEIGKDEKTWSFLPKTNWQERVYYLNIDGELEDVAGNTPVRAFDHDLKAPKLAPQKLRLEFRSQ